MPAKILEIAHRQSPDGTLDSSPADGSVQTRIGRPYRCQRLPSRRKWTLKLGDRNIVRRIPVLICGTQRSRRTGSGLEAS